MRKIIGIILIAFCCFVSPIYAYDFEIRSKNALLYNLDENKILYEKGADEEIAIASLTKIMTAIVAIENINSLNEQVILVSKDFEGLIEANASVAGFREGQIVTYRDLLYGLLLPSGADAAQALTRTIAGSKETFVNKMNEKAKELGMQHTHFANETGLDAENHYSTLKDVARLFQYALKNDDLKTILQSDRYVMSDTSFLVSSTIFKNIKRYQIHMDYILGGKTGTTNHAGLCLASIAHENGTNYMLITARAPYPAKQPYSFLDAKTIYDYFISHFENKEIVEKNEFLLSLSTQYAKEDSVQFTSTETIQKYLPMEFHKGEIETQYQGIDVVKYNTRKGTKLGILELSYQGEIIATIDIVLNNQLHFSILKYLKAHMIFVMIILMIIVVFILKYTKSKEFKKRKFILKNWKLHKNTKP